MRFAPFDSLRWGYRIDLPWESKSAQRDLDSSWLTSRFQDKPAFNVARLVKSIVRDVSLFGAFTRLEAFDSVFFGLDLRI